MSSRAGWGRSLSALLALDCIMSWPGLAGPAGERGVNPQLQRPPDIPVERQERPRLEQDRARPERPDARLSQEDAIGLAKAAAKKELGQSFHDDEVNAVVFDPVAKTWSVTFGPKTPRRGSRGCVIVMVGDATSDTKTVPCS